MLLSKEDVKIWFEHLQTIEDKRRRGATKAAATRRTQSAHETENQTVLCGMCRKEYEEETELWIACDTCYQWFHCTCEGLTELPQEDTYICFKCHH